MSGGALHELAAARGILPEWHDLAGSLHVTTPETQRALLSAMGVAAASDAEAAESLKAGRARREARRLPEEAVTRAGARWRQPGTGYPRSPLHACASLLTVRSRR